MTDELPPLPEPDGVIGAMWACVRSGPNYDGRWRDVENAAKAYARRYAAAAVARERANLLQLIRNDDYAMTFQTMGQYRSALLAAIRRG